MRRGCVIGLMATTSGGPGVSRWASRNGAARYVKDGNIFQSIIAFLNCQLSTRQGMYHLLTPQNKIK